MDGATHDIFSVSELTLEIKELLELHLPAVWVQGEISNFLHHRSGHMYFSLKDSNAQINCVMWRSRASRLFFSPQDGMRVNVYGSVRVYEKRGTYQIDITQMAPAGVGDLQLAFEALKRKLSDEGLFDDEFKKPLPAFPETIAIVTSLTGAAIRDIVHVLNRRYPSAIKIIRPTLVQGDGAAEDIAAAIQEFNAYGDVDVLIVGRGGGSIEDLWAFNEEVVARAVFESEIPVVSAVGHEVDFTICDFVADLRAPTPSAAAELVVPDRRELLDLVNALYKRTQDATREGLDDSRDALSRIIESYAFRRPKDLLLQYEQRLDDLLTLIHSSTKHLLRSKTQQFHQASSHIAHLHPDAVLKRGFAVVRDSDSHQVVRDSSKVQINDAVDILLYKGYFEARVETTEADKTLDDFLQRDKHE